MGWVHQGGGGLQPVTIKYSPYPPTGGGMTPTFVAAYGHMHLHNYSLTDIPTTHVLTYKQARL